MSRNLEEEMLAALLQKPEFLAILTPEQRVAFGVAPTLEAETSHQQEGVSSEAAPAADAQQEAPAPQAEASQNNVNESHHPEEKATSLKEEPQCGIGGAVSPMVKHAIKEQFCHFLPKTGSTVSVDQCMASDVNLDIELPCIEDRAVVVPSSAQQSSIKEQFCHFLPKVDSTISKDQCMASDLGVELENLGFGMMLAGLDGLPLPPTEAAHS